MEYEMFPCPAHGSEWPQVTREYAEANGLPYGCQDCQKFFEGEVPDTPEGRAEQLRSILSGGEGSYAGFQEVWWRVDALVGRSVYTHELAFPDYLEHEILTGLRPSLEGIVAKLPEQMAVIVVMADEERENDGS